VLPLVAERSLDVTSRELAQAAGVAEGTLFRAFGDKTALVGAVAIEGLGRAADPEVIRKALAAIDLSLPLEKRVELVIEQGRARTVEAMRWMTMLRRMAPLTGSAEDQHERMLQYREELMAQQARQREATVEGITAVLAPDLDRLRVPVDVAISLIESGIVGAHARFDHQHPAVPAHVLADALVNGLAGPERPGAPRAESLTPQN
jgi:AcrR family transcriptional regulator